jgi:extracellular factor (EF) 3-hydroxypalmitic acid methyl ester biosynthesis protein
VTFASGISLFVGFPSDAPPPDQSIFTRLLLKLPQADVELSRCRFHAERDLRGVSGRLVFLDDVYDCRSLIEGKVINVRTFRQNVPLVLNQKESIRPAFRDYTANVLFDLSTYKRFFDAQDRRIQDEPEHVANAAEASLLANEGRDFFKGLDAHLSRLDALVEGFRPEEHAQHGFYLRCLAWDYILGAPIFKRTNLKPRGYAGDAEMMVMLYENAFLGDSLFSKLLHKHALETPAAQAVRARRRLVAEAVLTESERWRERGEGTLRFASLAAGPAWELADLYRTPDDFRRLRCVLLDQDPHALDLARQTVERLEQSFQQRLDVRYLTQSVRVMLRGKGLAERLGRFHFLYSMGRFDYLTPPVAQAVLRSMYELLEPGGALLVGNFHVRNPNRNYMAYWLDWVLYHRTEEEMLELCAGLPGARTSIGFDPTACQMFLKVERAE